MQSLFQTPNKQFNYVLAGLSAFIALLFIAIIVIVFVLKGDIGLPKEPVKPPVVSPTVTEPDDTKYKTVILFPDGECKNTKIYVKESNADISGEIIYVSAGEDKVIISEQDSVICKPTDKTLYKPTEKINTSPVVIPESAYNISKKLSKDAVLHAVGAYEGKRKEDVVLNYNPSSEDAGIDAFIARNKFLEQIGTFATVNYSYNQTASVLALSSYSKVEWTIKNTSNNLEYVILVGNSESKVKFEGTEVKILNATNSNGKNYFYKDDSATRYDVTRGDGKYPDNVGCSDTNRSSMSQGSGSNFLSAMQNLKSITNKDPFSINGQYTISEITINNETKGSYLSKNDSYESGYCYKNSSGKIVPWFDVSLK